MLLTSLNEDSNIRNLNIDGSKKPTKVYSLDAVISVGYRVNSKSAKPREGRSCRGDLSVWGGMEQ